MQPADLPLSDRITGTVGKAPMDSQYAAILSFADLSVVRSGTTCCHGMNAEYVFPLCRVIE
jgi:hypothetical protein